MTKKEPKFIIKCDCPISTPVAAFEYLNRQHSGKKLMRDLAKMKEENEKEK